MQKHYSAEEKAKKAFVVSFDDSQELCGLITSLGMEIAGQETVKIREKNPKFGMGTGKAAELAEKAALLEADCLVFDTCSDNQGGFNGTDGNAPFTGFTLNPSQQRNWEELAKIPVLDRQEIIIRIFADRASTREAALQVRLVELSYFLPRLSHKYIDLSRQRGGRYGTRGAGETKLETDRRKVRDQIHRLEKELETVSKQRQVQRRLRTRQGLPVCAIVGYTNTGKSSLLNALTGASVLVEDKLFATLDATTRRFEPGPGVQALITDTVGFIRQLPHSLVKAFHSTLEEAALADVLIHVLDSSETDVGSHFRTTLSVLGELGAENKPMIAVFNKIDKLTQEQRELLAASSGIPVGIPAGNFAGGSGILVSVKTGEGLNTLKERIAQTLRGIM
jgi:GTP-binding protein HflX